MLTLERRHSINRYRQLTLQESFAILRVLSRWLIATTNRTPNVTYTVSIRDYNCSYHQISQDVMQHCRVVCGSEPPSIIRSYRNGMADSPMRVSQPQCRREEAIERFLYHSSRFDER